MSRSRSCTFRLWMSLKWSQIGKTLLLLSNTKTHVGFRLAFSDLNLSYSNGQLDHWNGVSPNIVAFLLRPELNSAPFHQTCSFSTQFHSICTVIRSFVFGGTLRGWLVNPPSDRVSVLLSLSFRCYRPDGHKTLRQIRSSGPTNDYKNGWRASIWTWEQTFCRNSLCIRAYPDHLC